MNLLYFLIGLGIGMFLGITIISLLFIAKRADERGVLK